MSFWKRKTANTAPSIPPELGRLLCLNCRNSGHLASDCPKPIGVFQRHQWFRSEARGAMRFEYPDDSSRGICTRCMTLNLLRWLKQSLKRIEEEADHDEWPPNKPCANHEDWVHRLGPVGSIKLWQNCSCCRCLFALTPEPSSLEQEVILFRTFSMFRLEQGVRLDTKEKLATSKCLSVILDFVDKKYWGQRQVNDVPTGSSHSKLSGDALCLVEDTPKHSKARIGARIVNPMKLDIGRVHDWLSECGRQHPRICRPTWNEKLMQIFLIDVEVRKIVSYPNAKCDYVALSYVWGGVDQYIPMAGESGGSLSMPLPATIEDAISLVKKLGKQYLWVDAICIDQMDPVQKLQQIGLMSDIYQGACMTIIAMSGTSANAGLARVGPTPVVQHQARFDTKNGTVVGIGPTLPYLISQLPWAKRGWTFQEAILSQRCLYLTEFQAYFECNAMQCCESLDISKSCESFDNPYLSVSQDPQESTDYKLRRLVKTAGPGEFRNPFVPGMITDLKERSKRYYTLVEQYKSRALSFESDAINAFAGILQAMEQSLYVTGSLVGLPVARLHCALLWEKADADLGKQNPEFPSWAWASWNGPVQMRFADRADEFESQDQGLLGQILKIWWKDSNGLTNDFARSENARFSRGWPQLPREMFVLRDLPLENAACLESLRKMSAVDAKHVLCVECYQLDFFFNPASPMRPKPATDHVFTIPAHNENIKLHVSDGSVFFKSKPFPKERKYLVIAAGDSFGPPTTYYYLLAIEPAGRFWRRFGILRLSVPSGERHALYALRPCRTRVLLI